MTQQTERSQHNKLPAVHIDDFYGKMHQFGLFLESETSRRSAGKLGTCWNLTQKEGRWQACNVVITTRTTFVSTNYKIYVV